MALGKKSYLTIASTAFVAAIILWVAHENWIDPAISNLQPVLDSYWLMIHVAVIVGSYGPLTLGMILGLTSLLLMVLTNKKNFKKIEQLRSDLIEQGDDLINETIEQFPSLDRQQMRQLVRNAAKEAKAEKPGKGYKELFQYLKDAHTITY